MTKLVLVKTPLVTLLRVMAGHIDEDAVTVPAKSGEGLEAAVVDRARMDPPLLTTTILPLLSMTGLGPLALVSVLVAGELTAYVHFVSTLASEGPLLWPTPAREVPPPSAGQLAPDCNWAVVDVARPAASSSERILGPIQAKLGARIRQGSWVRAAAYCAFDAEKGRGWCRSR